MLPDIAADPEGPAMFAREAALHAAVRHENVVEVYATGVDGAERWLAMELVEGCDLSQLLRRLASAGSALGVGVTIYVARELLRALEAVHTARQANGKPMGIVHRDMTPSNVYLSLDGRVKLGDFGIARSTDWRSRRSVNNAEILNGKLAYLAPEQVAGEPFDQRVDLFAAAAVVAEMLMGKPLFGEGRGDSGQLATLLAIRGGRIDKLRQVRASLPSGLFDVLEHALACDPEARFPTAATFWKELARFGTNPAAACAELGAMVRWVRATSSREQMKAMRLDVGKPNDDESPDRTPEYPANPSFVVNKSGQRIGPLSFVRLIEAIMTGEIERGDMVDYLARGLAPLESIEELARFLPPTTLATHPVPGLGTPDFVDAVSPSALVRVLVRIAESAATGVLFAQAPLAPKDVPDVAPAARRAAERTELYFVAGKLHYATSDDNGERLGEALVQRGVLSRDALNAVHVALSRYGGQMTDMLKAVGLPPSAHVSRAIRDIGRDLLVDLFRWRSGKLTFYAGHEAPCSEVPLDIDLLPLVAAGVEAAEPGDVPLRNWRSRLDDVVGPTGMRPKARNLEWPPLFKRLLAEADELVSVRKLVANVIHDEFATASPRARRALATDALRAMEVLITAGLLDVHVEAR
jgi:serine/threonine-protein kinase